MGCDIHMVREERGNDKWLGTDIMDIDRNYAYFGALAGVREEDIKHIPPRGIPDDASGTYRDLVEYWGADAHSHSYLSSKEMQEALTVCKEWSPIFIPPMGLSSAAYDEGNNVRYCFFFDN